MSEHDEPSTPSSLLARWREGDQQAEEELFSRYTTQARRCCAEPAVAQAGWSDRCRGRRPIGVSAVFSWPRIEFVIQCAAETSGGFWPRSPCASCTARPAGTRRCAHNVSRETSLGADRWVPPVFHSKSWLVNHRPTRRPRVIDELEAGDEGVWPPCTGGWWKLRLQGYQLKEIAAQTDRLRAPHSVCIERGQGPADRACRVWPRRESSVRTARRWTSSAADENKDSITAANPTLDPDIAARFFPPTPISSLVERSPCSRSS